MVSFLRYRYAAKLISTTLRNNFLPTIFQFTKTVKRETRTHHMPCQKFRLTTVDGKYWCGKPLTIPTLCRPNFHAIWHSATCRSMQKSCQSCATLTSTLFSAFAMWQSHILLHSVVRHSVDAS